MGRPKAGRQRRQSLLEQARVCGHDYSLSRQSVHQNRIDETQLGEYLDTKPKNVGTLEGFRPEACSELRLRQFASVGPVPQLLPQNLPVPWQRFDQLVDDGRLVSTREVFREIEDGPSESLLEWAKENRALFATPTAEEGAFVAQIYAVPHFQQNIEQKKLLRGGRVADPLFVIAQRRWKLGSSSRLN